MSAALLGSSSGAGAFLAIIYIAIIVLAIAGLWKTFTKAGHPGWGAIIPFYNIYLMCKVAKRPGWWLVLFLIPIVNFVIHLIVSLDIAKNFKKGSGFGIGLWLLSPIFFLILGFGSATYDEAPATA